MSRRISGPIFVFNQPALERRRYRKPEGLARFPDTELRPVLRDRLLFRESGGSRAQAAVGEAIGALRRGK